MEKEFKTVAFAGVCPARSKTTLVSKHIGTSFRLDGIHATFPEGCVDKMKLSFFISPDSAISTTVAPSGISILRDYGQVDWIKGNNTKKELRHNVEQKEASSYLKVFADNEDYFPHKVDVQMFIEIE